MQKQFRVISGTQKFGTGWGNIGRKCTVNQRRYFREILRKFKKGQ